MSGSGLVYSTDKGRMCPQCRNAKSACTCAKKSVMPKSDGVVRVSLDTKGRKGKGMTIVSGLPVSASEALMLAKELKQKCGSGGTFKDGCVEIQGDKREMVTAELAKRGFTVKKIG
ncbi:MAG: translation initiation factor Sui1 [Bacteroides sp.]|nr:translation initiation factor Sui1 [Bacteroides sp.]